MSATSRLTRLFRIFLCELLCFNRHIDILCGVENLATALAFDELDVVLAGDDTNLGMFAYVGHGRKSKNAKDFARRHGTCQCGFSV
jgi:hypothetical protein